MKRNKSYMILMVLFIVFGLYFTSYFTISIENRSGKTIETIELNNRFKHKTFHNIPNDSVITLKAFIPFDRKISVKSKTPESIQSYLFTAENAYAGIKYNTVVIREGISVAKP